MKAGFAKADLAQRPTIAQRRRKPFEPVVRTEQDAQFFQPAEIVGQRRQLPAGQVQQFQRIGEAKYFAGKLFEARQAQFPRAGEFAAAERLQGIGRIIHLFPQRLRLRRVNNFCGARDRNSKVSPMGASRS